MPRRLPGQEAPKGLTANYLKTL
ncbi:hypothetical protein BQ8482_110565 [Mesorhizobium delmotii]|uniref:Uncharacterized protein n=1 Tax=Mesorhizobium delmotii TaxID=1631247 RepID=A0A2P9ABX9_9HYPH|nr:hypothetical protein BQ8482_110565 [Mesorhizobium delmotii]